MMMDTTQAQERRYFGGVERLCGETGAQRIAAAHVVVVGLGGVGSWAAEALARSGVGALTLIDLDHVAPSNINRQAQALVSTFGQAKVLAMQARIAQINPLCRVRPIEDFVGPNNWPALLEEVGGLAHGFGPVDGLIDACDQSAAKLTLCAWAKAQGQGFAFATVGAAGGKRHAHQVQLADLAQVHHDRLLAGVRSRLRKQAGLKAAPTHPLGVACVFSPEPAVYLPQEVHPAKQSDHSDVCQRLPLPSAQGLNCHGYGSWVSVTATFGFCAAGWVLNRLAEASRPSLV